MQVRRWHKLLVLGLVVVCLVVAAVVAKRARAGSTGGSTAKETGVGNEHVPYAAVAMAKRETIATSLSIAGQFIPYQNVELHAKVAGYIRHIDVDIGDHVRQGQVLAVLEIPELVAQVDEAKAAVHHAEEEIARAQSDVSRAEADHVALNANATRLLNTDKARPGLIAQQELDDATAKDRASGAQVDAAKSALSAARQQLEAAKANQQHYSALNDYARITAPYDGIVTWRFSDTGSLVQAGTSNTSGLPVVTVAQINVLRLRIPVPESIAAIVKIGDSADVHVQATGEHFTGKIARFTNSLDTSTRTMQVEIDVPNDTYTCSQECTPMYAADPEPPGCWRYHANPGGATAKRQIQRAGGGSQNRVQPRQVQTGAGRSDRVEMLLDLRKASASSWAISDLSSRPVGTPKVTRVASNAAETGGSE